MPAKNTTKLYIEGGTYHLYNRGVEKRIIFLDQQDYSTFITYLREYLLPKNITKLQEFLSNRQTTTSEKEKIIKILKLNNFAEEITLLSYCLMSDHFHFLIRQRSSGAVDKFMNSLSTRYVMYFNKKYKRVGPLFQGVYKAALISTDEELLHLSRYLHKQALAVPSIMGSGQPSSYPVFCGSQKIDWVKPEEVVNFFTKNHPGLSYKSFTGQEDNLDLIYKLTIED